MMPLSRAGTFMIIALLSLMSCLNQSDKGKVEKQNREKFSSSDQRSEAQFLVDAVDKSFALLEVAEIGKEKLTDPEGRHIAEEFMQRQTSVAVRLKSYAEENQVSIPLSGPEKTRQRTRALTDKAGSEFKAAWIDQVERMNDDFRKELMRFYDRADLPLKNILDSMIMLIDENRVLMTSAKEE